MRVSPGCSPVEFYVWVDDAGQEMCRLPAFEWWPPHPGFEVVEGKQFIVVAERWQSVREPDKELLENGELRDVPQRGGRKYYNRSRRVARPR